MDSVDSVSDSEQEEELQISLPDLQEVLQRRGNAAIKKTYALPTAQFSLIQDTIRTESRTRFLFDDLFDDESGKVRNSQASQLHHQHQQLLQLHPLITEPSIHNNIGTTLSDESDASYNNRGMRRRHRSFYQQHIYTIDSVAYMLKIGFEEASDMVKQDPRMIEEYHAGTLRAYIKEKAEGMKRSIPLKPSYRNDNPTGDSQNARSFSEPSRFSQPLVDVPLQDLNPDDDDGIYSSGGDNSSDNSDSKSDSDSEEDMSQDPMVVFRGRTYKSIEQVSRGSGLPKSYYSMQIKTRPRVRHSASKRHQIQEHRVGVAKKKQALPHREALTAVPETEELNNVFTTGDDSQGTVQRESQDSLVYTGENSLTNTKGNVAGGVLEKFLKDTLMFPDPSSTTETFHRIARHQPFQNNDEEEAFEDNYSEFVPMLASRERIGKSKPNKSQVSQMQRRTPTGITKTRVVRRLSGSVKRADPMSTPQRPRITIRPLMRQKPVIESFTGRSAPLRPNVLKRGRTKPPSNPENALNVDEGGSSRKLKTTPINSLIGTHSGTPQKKAIYSKPQKALKKYYFVHPDINCVLPRPAHVSTVVYETLGHEYAIVNSRKQSVTLESSENDGSPEHRLSQDHLSSFRTGFQNSLAYRCLFSNERIDTDHEYAINLGGRTVVLSRLLQNTEDKLRELFEILANVSTLRLSSEELLMKSFHKVIEYCSGLSVDEAKSLVTMVDNFRFKLESFIRRTGRMKDIDFYFLSLSYMLYYCSFKIFESNYLTIFDFRIKANEILSLFFEFLGYIDGHITRRKLKAHGLFSDALSMLFVTHQDLTWASIQGANLKDLEFFKDMCAFYGSGGPKWEVVREILKRDISSKRTDVLRRDFLVVDDMVSKLLWPIDDQTLLVMFDVLKSNKFGNFLGEDSRPQILSEDGLTKSTITNVYINLLLGYGESGGKFTGRFLERITPVSKVTSDLNAFCNRLNIILSLLISSRRNFDMRLGELFSSCEFGSTVAIKSALNALDVMLRVNNAYGMNTKLKFLEPMIERLVGNEVFVESWETFVKHVDFVSLKLQTQKSFLSAVAPFSSHKMFFKSNVDLIREFTIRTHDTPNLEFLRDIFNELNPCLFPGLWCLLFGKLVRLGVDNWSRLIHFNNFDDEPRIYAFVLQTSGLRIYTLERDRFVLSLINHLVQLKYSSSLNAFIWEVSKLDPKLLNCNNVLVQTHRLQITINLVYNLLRNDSIGVRARFLAVIVNFIKKEYEQAVRISDSHYQTFAKRVIEFINIYGYEYVRSSKAFQQLSNSFDLSKKATEDDPSDFLTVNGNITESLKRLEEKLIGSFKSSEDFSTVVTDAVLSHNPKPFGSPESITESKIYSLCCSVSVHVEVLELFPSCWILLSELTKVLSKVVEKDRNITQMDMLCFLKILRLFPFALKHRKSRYEVFEILTLKNIYKVLFYIFHILDGTNDMKTFLNMAIQFTSSEMIYEIICPIGNPQFLIKAPEFIKTMILRANLTGYDRSPSLEKAKDELDILFNKFATSVEDINMVEDDSFVTLMTV